MRPKTGISTSPSTSLSAIPSTATGTSFHRNRNIIPPQPEHHSPTTGTSFLHYRSHLLSPQALGIKVEYIGSIVTKHIDRVNMATKKLGFSDYSR